VIFTALTSVDYVRYLDPFKMINKCHPVWGICRLSYQGRSSGAGTRLLSNL